jgi:hypothetical protein
LIADTEVQSFSVAANVADLAGALRELVGRVSGVGSVIHLVCGSAGDATLDLLDPVAPRWLVRLGGESFYRDTLRDVLHAVAVEVGDGPDPGSPDGRWAVRVTGAERLNLHGGGRVGSA